MRSLLKTKRGLSNAVSTLIILVVSVLLATVVTFYAINITSTRVQEEAVNIQKLHVWANNTDQVAAFVITNTGGKDILLDKIAVRGVECAWTTVYYWRASAAVTTDLLKTRNSTLTGSSPSITYATGQSATFTNALTTGGDIELPSGGILVVYIKEPGSVTSNDVGSAISLTVYTVNAEYIEECNVESAGA